MQEVFIGKLRNSDKTLKGFKGDIMNAIRNINDGKYRDKHQGITIDEDFSLILEKEIILFVTFVDSVNPMMHFGRIGKHVVDNSIYNARDLCDNEGKIFKYSHFSPRDSDVAELLKNR